jgi:hypothetical protein
MRALFLGFAMVCAAVSAAGSAEGSLPGAGTFAYLGATLATGVVSPTVVADR